MSRPMTTGPDGNDRPARLGDPVWIAGYQAARAGVKWWNNPHISGSREAGQWDAGHTRYRTHPTMVAALRAGRPS